MKLKTRKRYRSSKKRGTSRRHAGGVPNIFAIHLSENKNGECTLPGMTRDAIKEVPDSELSRLLNEYGPTFTCTMSDRKGCPSYHLLSKMNQKGMFGSTFKSCCKDSCNYVTKVLHFTMRNNNSNNNAEEYHHAPENVNPVERDEFMNEIRMQAKAASLGVAPPIRRVLLSKSKGIVIMDSMKEDLEDVIYKFVLDPKTTTDDAYEMGAKLANQLGPLIMKLHSHNIIHGDIHQGNVMFDYDGNCKLIDYGMSIPVPIDFLAEEYIRNDDISSQIMDAYVSDYKLSTDGTQLRGFTETKVFEKNSSMPTKVKLRTLFMALRDGLDDWLEKDIGKMYERVNKYIKAKGL